MDNALVQATLGASKIQTPTSTLGAAPEIAAAYQSNFQLPQSNFGAGAQAGLAQEQVQAQKAAAAAAEKAARDKSDPSKYQQIARKDGGYGFYDPEGNEISAADFAHITNKSISDILKNSQNPIDKGFINDYKNLQHYGELKQNSSNDPQARAEAEAIEKQIKKAYGVDIHKMPIGDVIDAFKAQYPTVFGGNKPGGVSPSQSLIASGQFAKKTVDDAGGPDYYNPYKDENQATGQSRTSNGGW